MTTSDDRRAVSRRALLGGGVAIAGAVFLDACGMGETAVDPRGPEVARAEHDRRRRGARVHDIAPARHRRPLTSVESPQTWTYEGTLPGEEIRVAAGDVLRVRVANGLPDPTTIHWHGVAPRNDVDGVPGVTRSPIAPGADFMYEFTVPDPGTYWFHPHVGVQLDRGLSAPLIVEDPDERPGPTAYCGSARGTTWSGRWCSTIGSTVSPATPDEQLAALRAGGGSMGDMHGSPTGIRSSVLGGDARDVAYPHYLVNRGG